MNPIAKNLFSIIVLAFACFAGQLSAADTPPFPAKTYVYKQAGDVKLEVDVYRAADAQPRPVLIFLHGGALIMGNRKGVPPDLKNLCQTQGYCLVSVEYRLAPEVKLPEIIDDLRDAIKWVSEKGPEVFHADAGKVAVAGQSAGGYLTMMAGLCEPRPKALVSYYGYGDVDGEWYTKPSEFYRTSTPLISKENAFKGVNLDANGAPLPKSQAPQNRGQYYRYLRQNGLWAKEVSGFDPVTEPRKFDPYCPVRNITDKYPPILMIHGTIDTDVPCQESKDMAEALKKNNNRHELILIEGAGHGLGNGDKKKVAEAYARAYEFIKEHLGSPSASPAPTPEPTKPSARFEVIRFKENPIIRPDMEGLEGKLGENINGPSLLRVPEWVEKPLGKYYLYFAHHAGAYIRLATADHLAGPWTIYKPGALHLEDAPGSGHIASPEIYIDQAAKEIRMYFHQPPPKGATAREQQTFVAISKDGLHFTSRPTMLGHAYMRVFEYKNAFYGYGMSGTFDGVFMRSKDGLLPFEDGPHCLPKVRHSALWRQDDKLYCLYTIVGETPERISLSTIDLSKDWNDWKPSSPKILLEPELDYEGTNLPLKPSQNGISLAPVRQLRDPAIFEEDGKRYLLYTVAGEKGIAIGELKLKDK